MLIQLNETFYDDSVTCSCGFSFCVRCQEEAHQPATCKQVETWNEKEKSDSENLGWIKANCKPCPKCGANIEKNQGCNHMKCQKCGADFCWLCGAEWSKHGSSTGGYYACNLYEDLKKKDKDFASKEKTAEDAKNELRRYMFHYERFANHGKSKTLLENKQLPGIKQKMITLHEKKNYPVAELQFFIDAANCVARCRQVLRWSYVVGYYIKDSGVEKDEMLFKH